MGRPGCHRLAVPQSPSLVTNPSDDDDFRDAAMELLQPGANDPSALEALLRVRYPRAVVRARSLQGETAVVWYVYRDGRWAAPARRK